jgi:2-polyprenyl-6-methoxyphenol hydroxylase-like FAD-dependent oxidoreductase
MTVENTPVTPCLRANRLRLRQWLATQIPIQWGKRLIRIKEELNGSIAYFEDGTSARGQVIVGADGVNSAGE